MTATLENLTEFLLEQVRQVQRNLHLDSGPDLNSETALGDALDSMAMVEFLALVSEACGVKPTGIEECVARRFTTVNALARAMETAGIAPRPTATPACRFVPQLSNNSTPPAFLASSILRLPQTVQPASELDRLLQRPEGWLARHAGIHSRRVWTHEDPMTAAVETGRECLARAGLLPDDVGALLVTSEAPPLLAGLAAALHHRLDLPPRTVALEIGGACTGFLAALWTARQMLSSVGMVLILAVEAPSRYLKVEPGAAGEAAALFGDGAAACVVGTEPTAAAALPLREVVLGTDGSATSLVRPVLGPSGTVELMMEGKALASRAIAAMTEAVAALLQTHALRVTDLCACAVHGGNGRMPALFARRLGLPPERILSLTPTTGNLGSASLPAAWAEGATNSSPTIWVAVGAGLTWGAALLG